MDRGTDTIQFMKSLCGYSGQDPMEALCETWKSGGVRHYSLYILLFCAKIIARDSCNIELLR